MKPFEYGLNFCYLIYKGAYNELIVWLAETELIFHSQNDEQVATDIGIKFDFDKIEICAIGQKEEAFG